MSMRTMSFLRFALGVVSLISVLFLNGCALRQTLDAKAQANGEAFNNARHDVPISRQINDLAMFQHHFSSGRLNNA